MGIVCGLPLLLNLIVLQLDVGVGKAVGGFVGVRRRLRGAEQVQNRLEGGWLRLLPICASIEVVPGQGMLHHGVFQHLAFPVEFRNREPGLLVGSRARTRHGLEQASPVSGMPVPIPIRRKPLAAIAQPIGIAFHPIHELKGCRYQLSGLTIPDLIDRNIGARDQQICDDTLVLAGFAVIVMVPSVYIIRLVLIVQRANGLFTGNRIAFILGIIRMHRNGPEVQGIKDLAVIIHHGHRQIL